MKGLFIVFSALGLNATVDGPADKRPQETRVSATASRLADSTAVAPKQHGLQAFPTAPMPNAYRGDGCVEMPNAYRGDNCVPMPNLYRSPLVKIPQSDSTSRKPLEFLPQQKKAEPFRIKIKPDTMNNNR
ncbi:hypothetical protein SAMN05421747_11069 [Parapedobacter composti]|uniref:Uncharacterized protein n=1 Tax=Parapedobacter composti TaxID=623281 RepID=A0A1I1IWK6_9SPHI|nr:hypothetical protein [Parapedobacter composti]SFC40271.1 hypothetical protein SAMN05421747_11069 [Parapedobacter composti]